jgi:hypothetical protein
MHVSLILLLVMLAYSSSAQAAPYDPYPWCAAYGGSWSGTFGSEYSQSIEFAPRIPKLECDVAAFCPSKLLERGLECSDASLALQVACKVG